MFKRKRFPTGGRSYLDAGASLDLENLPAPLIFFTKQRDEIQLL